MSGIFGLWRVDARPVDPESLARMSESLAHRGPDGAGTWLAGSVGLGQRMLRTTPESVQERQPLVALDGELVLTADARIDNRSDVISALELKPPHETISDADLLLAAFERWGDRCAEHLIGDFAFVAWDARRLALICFRDHFGVKPLYYFDAPGRLFAFASEVEALLTLEDVPDEINEIEVGRHLYLPLGVDEGATYYRYVQKLLPGHTLTVSSRGLDERPYWRLDPTRELKLSSDDEYAEAFRESFVEAVRCRLRSNTPVASLLSGGLDSSAITCAAAQLVGGSGVLHTLSAVYPSVRESDEQSFIDEVLARYAVIPHFFDAESVNPFAEIDRINRLTGGASYGGNLYLTWELYRIAASLGARVVLHGYDGDSTVSHGTYYTPELALSGRWLKLAMVSFPYSLKRGRSPIGDYLGLVRSAVRMRLRGVLGKDANRSTATPNPLINEDFASQFADRLVPDPKPPTTEREFHARMLTGQRLLEGLGWGEACGAGRGIEVRYPFFDVRLAELCLSFPPDQKIRRGWTRFVMRRAMEGILPPRIQWRLAKTRMHHGWTSAYRSNQNGRIQALMNEPNPMVSRYLDIERLRVLHERFMAGDATTSEQRPLWRAITIALWLTSQAFESRSSTRPSFSSSEK